MTTKRARIQAVLAGDQADRVPVAFWRHWPGDDQDAERLAEVTLAYDRRFDWDFAKVTPSSSYSVEGWGAQTHLVGVPLGERTYVRRVIERGADWLTIQPLAPNTGALARTIQSIRLLRAELGPDTPLLMTVFSPLSVARYLAGDDLFLGHLRVYRREVRSALDAITTTYQQYVAAAVDAGADGVFYSTSTAAHSVMSEAEYRELGLRDDLRVLEAAQRGWFNVLHLHSPFPMLPLAREYPCQAVNWDDRTSEPSLRQGKQILGGKAVVGGINQWGTLQQGTYAQVQEEAREAIAACDGRGMILGGGCTYPLTVPQGNLLAARRAVETA
ncbi:MAG: uroporphyrinogen decarboxylase [Chloroflexi bacterium]|nr:uroporphyrinogen decarboxylase [Chloroflexota bacterium]